MGADAHLGEDVSKEPLLEVVHQVRHRVGVPLCHSLCVQEGENGYEANLPQNGAEHRCGQAGVHSVVLVHKHDGPLREGQGHGDCVMVVFKGSFGFFDVCGHSSLHKHSLQQTCHYFFGRRR